MRLLIVESPSKAKKIASMLGRGWEVAASIGHIRDLPKKALGVEPPEYRPRYEISEGKRDVVTRLKGTAAQADEIYLATDPDREGEGIAWHLGVVLGLKKSGKPVFRVRFHDLSPESVHAAIANRGGVNIELVAAQEARRVIDRLVGYRVSPRLGGGLSAGRVQSPTLALVVDREREIAGFKPEAYYEVGALVAEPAPWRAVWRSAPYIPPGKAHFQDRDLAEAIAKATRLTVQSVKHGRRERRPFPPFVTSTLQQAASSVLRISPGECMDLAQSLFTQGLITYHRTDDPNLSDKAVEAVRAWLAENGLPAAGKTNKWKSKANAQEAHEAIRPVDFDKESAGKTDREQALYKLIHTRAIASQMPNAVYRTGEVVAHGNVAVPVDGKPSVFVAKGEVLTDTRGWLALPGMAKIVDKPDGDADPGLPEGIQEGRTYPCETRIEDKETRPPGRYTEASLIKTMERMGIGRPSTYASILATIKRREYVTIEKRALAPTPKGAGVIDALRGGRFTFIDFGYTARMEEQLDAIASGRLAYREAVSEVDGELSANLEALPKPPEGQGRSFNGGEPVGQCPCGGQIMERPKVWQCEACNALVWRELAHKPLTRKQALALLSGKSVKIKGMKSRKGATFEADVTLRNNGSNRGEVDFAFTNSWQI